MNQTLSVFTHQQGFDEAEWLKMLFLISDTQQWLDEMEKKIFYQLPLREKRKLFRPDYFLDATTLTHILERHYYKLGRHPGTSKFTIAVADIVHWIKEAYNQVTSPSPGTLSHQRCIDTGQMIGHDRYGQPTTLLTVITDDTGAIKTAFPGSYKTEI